VHVVARDKQGRTQEFEALVRIDTPVESAPGGWQGEQGRVDADMVRKYVSDLHQPIYYLSGPEGMVKSMRTLLVGLKVNEDNIRTEEFIGY
jgi:ferredoxin-NADP reductase